MKKLLLAILLIAVSIQLKVSHAFWSDPFYGTHQDITKTALSLNVKTASPPFCFSPDGTTNCYAFSANAITQINKRHLKQDGGPGGVAYDPNDHFDSNHLAQSLTKMAINRGQLNTLLTAGTFSPATQAKMWALMGNMLHAVEDFYAHSTWVDEGNSGNQIIGFGAATENTAKPNTNIFPVPLATSFCPSAGYPLSNLPVFYLITGYYSPINPPSGGCEHGATFPTLYSIIINQPSPSLIGLCDYIGTAPQTVPGISHDVACSGNFIPTNTQLLHQTAYSLAVQEAQAFVQSIVGDLVASNNAAGFCALLDLPSPVALCVPTGHLVARGINSSKTIVGWACPSGFIPAGQAGCQNPGSTGAGSAPSSAVATIAGQQYQLSNVADLTPCGFDLTQGVIAVAVSETGSILIEGSQPGTPLEPEASCLLTPAAPVNGVPQFIAAPLASPELGINSSKTIVGWACPSGFIPAGQAGCQNPGSTGAGSAPSSAVATIAGQQYQLSSVADLTPCGFDLTQGVIAVAVSETGSILIEGSQPGTPLEPEASCLLTPAAPVNGVPQFIAAPLASPELGINSSKTIVGWACPSGFIPAGQAGCQNPGSTGAGSAPSSAVATIAGQQYQLSSVADLTPCGFDLTQGVIAVAVSETGSILIEGSQPGTPLEPEASCLLTPAAPVNGVPQFVATPL